jgi:hypothetical protein
MPIDVSASRSARVWSMAAPPESDRLIRRDELGAHRGDEDHSAMIRWSARLASGAPAFWSGQRARRVGPITARCRPSPGSPAPARRFRKRPQGSEAAEPLRIAPARIMGREIGDVGRQSCLSAMAGDAAQAPRPPVHWRSASARSQPAAARGWRWRRCARAGDEGDRPAHARDRSGGYARRCAALRRW